LTPKEEISKALVCLFLIIGITFATFSMAMLTEIMLRKIEETAIETRVAQYTFPCCGPRVFGIGTLLFVIVTTGVTYGLVWEEWSLNDSVYFTIVTITTVGYGDKVPTTQAARMWISFYELFSSYMFAAIITQTMFSYVQIRKRAAAVRFLMGNMTRAKINAISKTAKVDRMAWMEFMLVKMGYCDNATIYIINDTFNAIDMDDSGILSTQDIVGTKEGNELLHNMRARHGIYEDDDSELPIGVFGLKFKFIRKTDKDLHPDSGWEVGAVAFHGRRGRCVVVSVSPEGEKAVRFEDGEMLRFTDPVAEKIMVISPDLNVFEDSIAGELASSLTQAAETAQRTSWQ